VHLSGCAKGCAHPGPATLTLVGGEAGCGVVLRGRAGDTPAGHVPAGDLSDGLARFVAEAKARRLPGETVADLFRRLGGNAVASILLGETGDG
jgi:precorrin-3B synthase